MTEFSAQQLRAVGAFLRQVRERAEIKREEWLESYQIPDDLYAEARAAIERADRARGRGAEPEVVNHL